MPPGKFDGIDFSQQPVQLLTAELAGCLGPGFRCVRPEFVTFWKRGRIAREQAAALCQCWVVAQGDALAGYVTLLTDMLRLEAPLLQAEGVKYKTLPAVKIGLLAADHRARGAGRRLVEWALEYAALELAPRVGLRFVTVDAFFDPDNGYDASGFYQKLGFRFANPHETLPPPQSYRTLYFDLKPLIDAFAALATR